MSWQEWLAAGIGQAPASEVVAAKQRLDRRAVREARRMMRQGRQASDPAQAALVVALARESQRQRQGIGPTMAFVAMIVFWAWLSAEQLDRGGAALGVLWAGVVAWGAYILWIKRREASKREQGGTQQPPTPGGDRAALPNRVDAQSPSVSLAHRLMAVAVLLALYDVTFGALTQAMDSRSLSINAIVARGALFAIFMTVANLTLLRWPHERRAERPIAGHGA